MYLIQHCAFEYNKRQRRLAFEIYVTDRLQAINESIAKTLGGSMAKSRYIEMIEGLKQEKEPDVTAEQVISSISDKLERLNDERI